MLILEYALIELVHCILLTLQLVYFFLLKLSLVHYNHLALSFDEGFLFAHILSFAI